MSAQCLRRNSIAQSLHLPMDAERSLPIFGSVSNMHFYINTDAQYKGFKYLNNSQYQASMHT